MNEPPLIAHLESCLGRIEQGWSVNPEGEPMPFQVAAFRGGVLSGVQACATIGLSDTGLVSERGQCFHLECMMAHRGTGGTRNFPALLQTMGLVMLEKGRPLLKGQTIGFSNVPVVNGTGFNALWVAHPAYWPEEFEWLELPEYTVTI